MKMPHHGLAARDPISVIVVDDSPTMQMAIQDVVLGAPDFKLAGGANDAFEAKRMIEQYSPDVLTLDVEMPGMNGLTFLEKLMAWHPMPVVMVSGSKTQGVDLTLTALELGAVDFVSKPRNIAEKQLFTSVLKQKIRLAAFASPSRFRKYRPNDATRQALRLQKTAPKTTFIGTQSGGAAARPEGECRVIAVGSSTGGVTSLEIILNLFPDNGPPMVIAQHMPKEFTERFARRLSKNTGLDVAEATHGEILARGSIRLAPGNRHLYLKKRGTQAICQLRESIPEAEIQPSANVLFRSVAENFGSKSAGVILSGMGRDGAQGLLAMRKAGAETFGESKNTCTVYGMPRAAQRLQAVVEELDISALAQRISTYPRR